ncbi:quaternary ammonium compound-resistance protein SugE [Chitinophaga terrae (ex Kim and Jung 2007)]|uniref:Guanidinium exporter n=1 Tax=Chitinophaga terrae (ex Kim and Jung 2007) TaxID=408074 RepID=A0A1H4DUL1_9BACT|nr:multidrug efflux SMR transporter [Chitinophaga terrae (ex Kim and Jung 2007)]MDQ0105020.1 quaternary ammonium compound-resistance protein SugE [Chitinophaga terrae (ex Kim and Jung 2007)]GEP91348.1 molecular chaperone [Chitinophaga terrae (ex Kim and Jung 2007)]SEA76421.1 quaternary ammonium compound-resistance protein SugE [Chitinophaga terrae (ex Kim and Jung 2007)]
MPWLFLVIGGLFEIGFTISLKYSENFTKLWPSLSFIVCISLSFFFLNKAINGGLPIGTSYAVWTGIGAAGTAIAGMLFFKEPVMIWRIFFLVLLIGSIVGLKFVSGHE